MNTTKTIGVLCAIFIVFAVPLMVASLFGSVAGFLVLGAESLIGARVMRGQDNGGWGILFLISLVGAFGAGIIWLFTGAA